MQSKLATFLNLSAAERRLTLEAIAALCAARFKVFFVPSKVWRGELDDQNLPGDVDLESASQVMRAIERASRNLPGHSKCLPLALAARTLLTRRGTGSTLGIGVRTTDASTRDFHAWLKVGDMFVTGACDETQYHPLTHGFEAAS